MTGNEKISLADAFDKSVKSGNWLTASDAAAIQLGRALAVAIDSAMDHADGDALALLAPKMLAVLKDLHLTVETRNQGKQHDTDSGEKYAGDYLRLVSATAGKSKSGTAKRRSTSKQSG